MSPKPYFRFKWSHLSLPHRLAVKTYNTLMRFVPFAMKYSIGKRFRQKRPPYCLVEESSVVVQIGAPRDILSSGRSRGMYFSLFAGNNGKVLIIEPDPESIKYSETVCQEQGIQNVILCQTGAWSEKTTLQFFINDAHPAANLTEEAAKRAYNDEQLRNFRVVEIPVNTIDNILAEHHIKKVDLIILRQMALKKRFLKEWETRFQQGCRTLR